MASKPLGFSLVSFWGAPGCRHSAFCLLLLLALWHCSMQSTGQGVSTYLTSLRVPVPKRASALRLSGGLSPLGQHRFALSVCHSLASLHLNLFPLAAIRSTEQTNSCTLLAVQARTPRGPSTIRLDSHSTRADERAGKARLRIL